MTNIADIIITKSLVRARTKIASSPAFIAAGRRPFFAFSSTQCIIYTRIELGWHVITHFIIASSVAPAQTNNRARTNGRTDGRRLSPRSLPTQKYNIGINLLNRKLISIGGAAELRWTAHNRAALSDGVSEFDAAVNRSPTGRVAVVSSSSHTPTIELDQHSPTSHENTRLETGGRIEDSSHSLSTRHFYCR